MIPNQCVSPFPTLTQIYLFRASRWILSIFIWLHDWLERELPAANRWSTLAQQPTAEKKKRRHWHGQTGQVGGGAWRPAMSGLTICLPTVRPGVPKKKNKKVEQQFMQVRWDGGGGKVGNSGLNICKGRTPKVFVVDNGTEAFYFGVS